jgi:DNA-directed RNA polymerase specialized sigma subunit
MQVSSDRLSALEWALQKLSAKKGGAQKQSPIGIPKAEVLKPAEVTFFPAKPKAPKAPIAGPPLTAASLPIASTPAQKKKELSSKKKSEIELWEKWNSGGRKPKDLDPLLKSMQPLIENRARIYKNNVEIPNAAIDFEHKRLAVEALQKYDPSKGAALGTWVSNYLKKASRFIQTHQNFARITEPIAAKIGKFNAARAELTERLGFEPDAQTLSEETGFSLKEIKRLTKDQRKGLVSSGITGTEVNPASLLSSREQEVVHLIYHQLTPQERIVHEYTFGLMGKPVLKPGQIAKQLKMDSSKVAKIRTSIFNKMKPHLE